MSTIDTFKKWFKIITTKQLNWSDMEACIKELLPGYSFCRSSQGPKAIKYIYDSDKLVFQSGLNYDVGIKALRMAANTDYKKAILEVYETKKKINNILFDLRQKLSKFNIDVIIDNGQIDIVLDDQK